MLKTLSIFLGLGLLAWAPPALAQPAARAATHGKMCQGVFEQNRTRIESLTMAGDTAGVQALFARAGCQDVALNLAKPSGQKSNIEFSCSFTINPLLLECHRSLAATEGRPALR